MIYDGERVSVFVCEKRQAARRADVCLSVCLSETTTQLRVLSCLVSKASRRTLSLTILLLFICNAPPSLRLLH